MATKNGGWRLVSTNLKCFEEAINCDRLKFEKFLPSFAKKDSILMRFLQKSSCSNLQFYFLENRIIFGQQIQHER